jgi:hypothetical protein
MLIVVVIALFRGDTSALVMLRVTLVACGPAPRADPEWFVLLKRETDRSSRS